jgi:hypothetical protein
VDSSSSDEFLLQRKYLMVTCVLYAPTTAPPDTGPDFGFCFKVFYVAFLVFSQPASVMLKS